MRDLGKLIVANGFKKLTKVQEIAQSGHTARDGPIAAMDTHGGQNRVTCHSPMSIAHL